MIQPSQATHAWPDWACPKDGLPLAALQDGLVCAYGDSYAIRVDIPRFVPDSQYTEHFGTQWNTYRRTQLDSYTGLAITRQRLRRALGEHLWKNAAEMNILECGCGAGRFTEILLDLGARVTSVDLSSAVDANRLNFPITDHHRIAQADILSLPFREQQYDIVVCLGVVQHTPNPEATIAALYRQVAPGGSLVIDHYTYRLRWFTTLAPLVRQALKRLPPDRALKVTERFVDIFLPLHKRFAHVRPVRAVLARISPVQSYYTQYPQLTEEQQREWALLDTHDSLTDWYKHARTRGQIERFLKRLGAGDISSVYAGNGVEARAVRPL